MISLEGRVSIRLRAGALDESGDESRMMMWSHSTVSLFSMPGINSRTKVHNIDTSIRERLNYI